MQRDNWGKWTIVIALLVIVAAAVVLLVSLQNPRMPVTVGSGMSFARVAKTDAAREKGLSGAKSLAENESMLFVFDVPGRWGMWMKDMHYSLDILWIDGAKKVVYIAERVAPSTYPKIFLPQKDALYVLELPAGYVQKHDVRVGQTVTFQAP